MGKARGSEGGPRWSPPPAATIKPGDRLHYYTIERDFELEVLSLQHGGEWIFGWDARDRPETRRGPIAVRRENCMSQETAERVLKDLPRIHSEDPE